MKITGKLLVLGLALTPGFVAAQGGGNAVPAQSGVSRLSPVVGGGQSPAQAAGDNQPNHTRASPYSHPSRNPNQPGNAASDGTAGTSSPRSPEPKPAGN